MGLYPSFAPTGESVNIRFYIMRTPSFRFGERREFFLGNLARFLTFGHFNRERTTLKKQSEEDWLTNERGNKVISVYVQDYVPIYLQLQLESIYLQLRIKSLVL